MNLTFDTSSNMFSLPRPDCYSRSEEIEEEERNENEHYEERLNELVDGVKRRDLPPDHPEFLAEGEWEIDGQKYLKNHVAQAWVSAFEDFLEARDKTIKFQVKYTGTSSPKEYNFQTDAAEFDLTLSLDDLEKIRGQVFEHEIVFDAYLYEIHSSYSGYRSFVPNNLEGWSSDYCSQFGPTKPEGTDVQCAKFFRAVQVLLDFWLLAFDGPDAQPSMDSFLFNQKYFDAAFFGRHLEDQRGNGVVQDCFYFTPRQKKCMCA